MKYTTEQLKEKAQAFMQFQASADPRCELMLMMLCIVTQVSTEDAIGRIAALAE